MVGAAVRLGAGTPDRVGGAGAEDVAVGLAGWVVALGREAGRVRGRLRDAGVAGLPDRGAAGRTTGPAGPVEVLAAGWAGVASAMAAAMPPVARMAATATPRVTPDSRRSARSRSGAGGRGIDLSGLPLCDPVPCPPTAPERHSGRTFVPRPRGDREYLGKPSARYHRKGSMHDTPSMSLTPERA